MCVDLILYSLFCSIDLFICSNANNTGSPLFEPHFPVIPGEVQEEAQAECGTFILSNITTLCYALSKV